MGGADGELMRTIYLIRHAKSAWDIPGQKDWDRDLNSRGRRDGPIMAEYCRTTFAPPERLLASDSVRTRATASFLTESGWIESGSVVFRRELYLAGPDEIFSMIGGLDESVRSVAVLAHNPGIHQTMMELSRDRGVEKFPTFGVASLECGEDGPWRDCLYAPWQTTSFVYPKKLSGSS